MLYLGPCLHSVPSRGLGGPGSPRSLACEEAGITHESAASLPSSLLPPPSASPLRCHLSPQVPIIWTVYLLISFREFELLRNDGGNNDPARQPWFFEVGAARPAGQPPPMQHADAATWCLCLGPRIPACSSQPATAA